MTFRIVAASLTLTAVAASTALAAQRGYLMSVAGQIVSVDPARGTVVLHHGMLETADAGNERCRVEKKILRALRRGMFITATADTRHHPWRLSDVRPVTNADDERTPGSTTRVSVAEEVSW